jgi:hypothetical protein
MCKCGGSDEHNHQITEQTKNLFKFIDVPKCKVFNIKNAALLEKVLGKQENSSALQSDTDSEILFKVQFVSNVKLKAIAIKSNAKSLKCFVNNESLSFSSCLNTTAQQEWVLVDDESVILEYPTKIYKFSNVGHLTLLLGNESEETKIYYIGFMGDVLDLRRTPVIADYELRPNLSDHKTGGLFDVDFSNRL